MTSYYQKCGMLEEIKKYVELTKQDLNKQVILKKKDDIFFLLLNKPKANSFNHEFMRAIHAALDQVQSSEGAACLVSCSLNDKIFSAGLDLKYVSTFSKKEQFYYFVLEFIAMFGRLAVINIPTIAVVKGAAIAGGCMFSFAHDFVYVIDKATFACNEVDIGLHLPPGMNAIIKRKHSNPISFRDMTLFGKKFSEKQAMENKMIDGIVNNLAPVIEKAQSVAPYGTNRVNFKNLKVENNKEIIEACFNKQHAVGAIGQFTLPSLPKL